MSLPKVKILGNASLSGSTATVKHAGCLFTVDPACTDYDWLVVFDELPFQDCGTFRNGCERLCCPPDHTILCTWEPVSIKSYSQAYIRQFRHYLSNRPEAAEHHPGYHLGRGYFPGFHDHSPEELKHIPAKTKLVSAVCSAKQMKHTQHHARFQLIQTLAAAVPGFDWFGRGVKPLQKKYEALDAYRYHVAVENHIAPHHWTEKFSDAILCECLPFYAGDPLIGEIFPKACYIPIPIDDPSEAVRIVRDAIANGEYEKRRDAVLEAKRLILTKYNLLDQVIDVIRSAKDDASAPKKGARIYARRALRWHSLRAAVEDLSLHIKRAVHRA